MSFYTGETYEARCARLAQRPDETLEQWRERMDAEMQAWLNGRPAP